MAIETTTLQASSAESVSVISIKEGGLLPLLATVYSKSKIDQIVGVLQGRDITSVLNYSALPEPSSVTDRFYFCMESQGTQWLPGSIGGTYYAAGVYYSNGTTWSYTTTAYQASQSEVNDGIIADKFVAPDTLQGATLNRLQLNTNPSIPTNTAAIYYNVTERTVSVVLDDGGTAELGKEQFDHYTVLESGGVINGDIVSICGASGNRSAVSLTDVTSDVLSVATIGMVTVPSIANNNIGRITTRGHVHNLNTNGMTEGLPIYVHPTNNGKWTQVKPNKGTRIIQVGIVVVAHQTNGIIDVNPIIHTKFGELIDVELDLDKNIPVDTDKLLIQDSENLSIWKPISWFNFKSLFLQTVNRNNSLTGDGKTIPLGIASMFDRARTVGLQYVEDFEVANAGNFLQQKGFSINSVNVGTTTFIDSKAIISSSSSSVSGAYIGFFGSGSAVVLRPYSYFKQIEAIASITSSTTDKVLNIGVLSGSTVDMLTHGIVIEFRAGRVYAKAVKNTVITQLADLMAFTADTIYRIKVDMSNPLSIVFSVYDTNNNLLASHTSTNTGAFPLTDGTQNVFAGARLIKTTTGATTIGYVRAIGVTLFPINL